MARWGKHRDRVEAAQRAYPTEPAVQAAAGAVLVTEAGGRVTDLEGRPTTGEMTVAAPLAIHGPLLDLLRSAGADHTIQTGNPNPPNGIERQRYLAKHSCQATQDSAICSRLRN